MSKEITVNKLKQRLSGMHYTTSNEWISKYIEYFPDSYMIFPIEILSPNARYHKTGTSSNKRGISRIKMSEATIIT